MKTKVDKALLRQAAEKCRYANGAELVEAMRHLQACFGWQTVLALIDELDELEERVEELTCYISGTRAPNIPRGEGGSRPKECQWCEWCGRS